MDYLKETEIDRKNYKLLNPGYDPSILHFNLIFISRNKKNLYYFKVKFITKLNQKIICTNKNFSYMYVKTLLFNFKETLLSKSKIK